MAELPKIPWDDWKIVQPIGSGSFGTVYEIHRDLIDGDFESEAVKIISVPRDRNEVEELYSEGYDDESVATFYRQRLKNIVNEYTFMRKMDGSANVVNCKDVHYVPHENGIGWDIFIRMELLTPLMKALPDAIADGLVIKLGQDICKALILCKKNDIIHRDIKPQNILFPKMEIIN